MISGPELTFLMTKKDAKVIDIRTQQEYMQGHIFNSINILANDINQGYWKELEKYKLNTIIIVGSDLTNIEENKLALKIKRLGFPHIYILEDGIRGWNKLNLPLVMGK
ncbi:MAG: rhodanese-like domain-containing protein [Candidatus Dasytiphilus stammeri]